MIVDSNVVIDLLHGEGERAEKVIAAYVELASIQSMRVNAIIVAETASGSPNLQAYEGRLAQLRLEMVQLDTADAYRASHAFRDYRRKGGPRETILPDFLIGAQAEVKGWPILTRDPKRFSNYFPEVRLIDPLKA